MKKIFYLLIPIFLFFQFQIVNATSLSPTWVDISVTNNYNPQSINFPSDVWKNQGRGYVLGSVSISRPNDKPAVVTSIYLHSDTFYTCEIINTTQKSLQQSDDSYVDFDVYSLKCPVILSSNGLDYMSIIYQTNYQVTTTIRGMWGFVSEEYTNDQLNTIIGILQNSSSSNEIASKLDEVNKSITESNKKIDKINDTLNDTSSSGAKTDFDKIMNNNSFDVNDSPISSLVTLPLKILNVYNDAVSSSTYNRSSCPSLDMGKMFGVNWLVMPCIFPEKYLGSTLWSIIDIVTTALLLWSLSHQLIKVYINFTSLDGKMTEKIVTQTGGML